MADNIFDEWIEIADNFQKKADAVLAEVRKCKRDMYLLRNEIIERIDAGQFIRDDNRIVISAPEIIIGNVDHNGALQGGGKIIIKGSTTEVHGVGAGGCINIVAPLIQQIAANPGIDGTELVVGQMSEVRSVARQVHIESQDPKAVEGKGACFISNPTVNGVKILSDSGIRIDASKKNKGKKKLIEDQLKALNSQSATYGNKASGCMIELKNLAKTIKKGIEKDGYLSATDDLGRANVFALDEVAADMETEVNKFSSALQRAGLYTSHFAEMKRRIACLQEEKSSLPSDDDYKNHSNGGLLLLRGESVNVVSQDGEGEIRTNEGAGITLQGNNIDVFSTTMDGKLTPPESKGRVSIRSRNVSISTDDFNDPKFKDGELTAGKFPLQGNVSIMSKTIDMAAVDTEMKDGKFKETALTKDSAVNIRAEKVKIKTIDEKGKSIGKFTVNSQKIALKSTDIKDYKTDIALDDQDNFKQPEKMSSANVAEKSSMLLLSETMNIGYKRDKLIAKDVFQVASGIMIVAGGEVLEVAQATPKDTKSAIDLCDGELSLVTAGKLTASGKGGVEIVGDAQFGGKVKAGDVDVDNLNASKSVKSPNFNDGMKVPGSPKQGKSPKIKDIKDTDL